MTSQLNVDTIVDKAGSGGTNVKIGNTSTYVSDGGAVTQNTVQGLAKSWANLNGTGDFTLAIANDMANGAYAISFGYQNQSSNQGSHIRLLSDGHKLAATVQCQKMENNSATDGDTNTVMIAGDLA